MNKSTHVLLESAINDVLYEWRGAQNKSKIIIAVFLDFQRAFETIDRNLLIKKLANYGVNGRSLDWFKSYLKNRKQVVKIGMKISNQLDNELGVPQRSILGPLLFILYINNITKCLKYCTAKNFADDTLVYIIADSIDDAISKLNEDLAILYKLLCQNKLKLNVSKTKGMIITNQNVDKNVIRICINEEKIEIENKIKYLGVIIDDKLIFDENIDHVCKKIGTKISVMGRLRNELNCNQKLNLYKTIIEPHFTYCSSILYLSNNTSIERLQKLQNKCMRQILRLNNLSNRETMLNALNLFNVNQTIMFRTLIFIFKIINGLAPNYLTKNIIYKHETTNRSLRNGNEICVTDAIKACSQNQLFYKGIKLFNTLPIELKNQDNLNRFQTMLKAYTKENF